MKSQITSGQLVTLIPHPDVTHATNKPTVCVIENGRGHLGILVSKKVTETKGRVRLGNPFYARTDGREAIFTEGFQEVWLQMEQGFHTAKVNRQVLPVPSQMPYLALGILPEERHRLLELLKSTHNGTQQQGIEQIISLLTTNPQTGFSARTEWRRWYWPWPQKTSLITPPYYADQYAAWEAER